MSTKKTPFNYCETQFNLYGNDIETLAHFYSEMFGFKENYRTPKQGKPIYIEVRLDNFTLGIANVDAARDMHHVDINIESSKGEIAVMTEDVDAAYNYLVKNGVKSMSEPHSFLNGLRSAWVVDPEGNPIHIGLIQK